jgi:acyl-CoA synthetase (AMP-forming)/AMP-acid ligase II
MRLHSYLLGAARDRPGGVAASTSGDADTYAALDRRSNGVAQRLLECGVMPGDRVIGHLVGSSSALAANEAILRTGATCVLIDQQLPPAALRAVVLDCVPAAIFSPALSAALSPAGPVLDAVRLVGASVLPIHDPRDDAGSELVDVYSHQDDCAYLAYYADESGAVRRAAFSHGVISGAVDAILLRRTGDVVSEHQYPLRFDVAVAFANDLRAIRQLTETHAPPAEPIEWWSDKFSGGNGWATTPLWRTA